MQMEALRNKIAVLEDAQVSTNSRLYDLEQEQTYQYKDIDSMKRAIYPHISFTIRSHFSLKTAFTAVQTLKMRDLVTANASWVLSYMWGCWAIAE
jgi:hypothetical protein